MPRRMLNQLMPSQSTLIVRIPSLFTGLPTRMIPLQVITLNLPPTDRCSPRPPHPSQGKGVGHVTDLFLDRPAADRVRGRHALGLGPPPCAHCQRSRQGRKVKLVVPAIVDRRGIGCTDGGRPAFVRRLDGHAPSVPAGLRARDDAGRISWAYVGSVAPRPGLLG